MKWLSEGSAFCSYIYIDQGCGTFVLQVSMETTSPEATVGHSLTVEKTNVKVLSKRSVTAMKEFLIEAENLTSQSS